MYFKTPSFFYLKLKINHLNSFLLQHLTYIYSGFLRKVRAQEF